MTTENTSVLPISKQTPPVEPESSYEKDTPASSLAKTLKTLKPEDEFIIHIPIGGVSLA